MKHAAAGIVLDFLHHPRGEIIVPAERDAFEGKKFSLWIDSSASLDRD